MKPLKFRGRATVQCCEFCGRDTTGKICGKCLGTTRTPKESRGGFVIHEEAEDRYDDESGPDDVYMEYGSQAPR